MEPTVFRGNETLEVAKCWEEAREWARRGLDVYGEQAARPEVVEDLYKRLAHAESKLAEATHPRERKPRAVAVATARRAPEIEIEMFVCASCGGSFERERMRLRKPALCPTCRGTAAPVTGR